MQLTLPARPIPEPELTPAAVADALDRAAVLIEQDGLYDGDWWPNAVVLPWEPGTPCDVTGAIGVACGYRAGSDIDYDVVGVSVYDPVHHVHVEQDPHPAFAAVMRHLSATEAEQVFRWSDDARANEVIERLRMCAAELRMRVPA